MNITDYGTVSSDEHGTEVYATRLMLWDWAHRPDALWPCSELATLDEITVSFDSRGDLVDIVGDSENLTAHELNAWTSDVLRLAGFPDHPAIR